MILFKMYRNKQFATIFTPQGDGNKVKSGIILRSVKNSPRYLPRKGTETSYQQRRHYLVIAAFATIFTPQGDGNTHHLAPPVCAWLLLQFATIFTPQGDGNHRFTPLPVRKDLNSPRYLPRKGTETSAGSQVPPSISIFATIFTPQGDGNFSNEPSAN